MEQTCWHQIPNQLIFLGFAVLLTASFFGVAHIARRSVRGRGDFWRFAGCSCLGICYSSSCILWLWHVWYYRFRHLIDTGQVVILRDPNRYTTNYWYNRRNVFRYCVISPIRKTRCALWSEPLHCSYLHLQAEWCSVPDIWSARDLSTSDIDWVGTSEWSHDPSRMLMISSDIQWYLVISSDI